MFMNESSQHRAVRIRRFEELPAAVTQQGWRFHHVGVPSHIRREGEHYLPTQKVFASGFDRSAYGYEWLRFEPDSPVPELVQSIPHIAFEVDDIDSAIAGKQVIFPPFTPYEGVRAAMFVENGAPIEVLQFS
jgi:hypothetical protein